MLVRIVLAFDTHNLHEKNKNKGRAGDNDWETKQQPKQKQNWNGKIMEEDIIKKIFLCFVQERIGILFCVCKRQQNKTEQKIGTSRNKNKINKEKVHKNE